MVAGELKDGGGRTGVPQLEESSASRGARPRGEDRRAQRESVSAGDEAAPAGGDWQLDWRCCTASDRLMGDAAEGRRPMTWGRRFREERAEGRRLSGRRVVVARVATALVGCVRRPI